MHGRRVGLFTPPPDESSFSAFMKEGLGRERPAWKDGTFRAGASNTDKP